MPDRTPSRTQPDEPLSPAELRGYERRLRHLLGDLRADVAATESGVLEPSGAERGQPDDESLEDEAFQVERERLAVEDQLGYEVREALQRLRDGTFGRCTSCGGRIARERLDVVPQAALCSACASAGG